MTFETFFNF